jgi:NAD(P)-dependent dehydrogenase (short-subunit alcohol dehydrogenase family)
MKLTGKVAAVTGGAGGIGQACGERFAAEGARVVLFDIDAGKAEAAARAIGPSARGEALDVREPEAVEAAMRRVAATEGGLDILVASAAVPFVKPILEIEPGDSTSPACSTARSAPPGSWPSGAPAASSTSPRSTGCAPSPGAAPIPWPRAGSRC